jgi:hypothetical protein
MSRKSFLVVGLVVGLAIGAALFGGFKDAAGPKGTPFLRELSFAAVAARAGQANWDVIEDRVYDPLPALGRSKRIARRIVAHAVLPDADPGTFARRFQQAMEEALASHGAVLKGEFDASRSSARLVNGSPVPLVLELPRRYYALGSVHGVADAWCIGASGEMTVIISLIEGQ